MVWRKQNNGNIFFNTVTRATLVSSRDGMRRQRHLSLAGAPAAKLCTVLFVLTAPEPSSASGHVCTRECATKQKEGADFAEIGHGFVAFALIWGYY